MAGSFPPSTGQYSHVDIWGGCCGTWDAHLDEIAFRVREARGLLH